VRNRVSEYAIVGMSHHTAPVAMRERFAVDASSLRGSLNAVLACPAVEEAVLLCTCNRVEWYVAGGDPRAAADAVAAFFDAGGTAWDSSESPVRASLGKDAVRHVFRVASGLDSMVVGESQILGQVRAAFAAGRSAGSVGPCLDALFRAALTVGRRVRRETEIGRVTASVPAAAVAHATRLLGSLAGRRVLVIGAGKMGEATVHAMVEAGARTVVVANRTPETARALAALFGGAVAPFETLPDALAQADVAIVSTGAHDVILDARVVAAASRGRTAPLVIVDIAVPRNVDPAAGRLPGVSLCDVDALIGDVHGSGAGVPGLRHAEALVESEVMAFLRARAGRGAASVIAAARADADAIVEDEWGRVRGHLASLTQAEAEAVRGVLHRVAKKLLHRPITTLAAAAESGRLEAEATGDGGDEA